MQSYAHMHVIIMIIPLIMSSLVQSCMHIYVFITYVILMWVHYMHYIVVIANLKFWLITRSMSVKHDAWNACKICFLCARKTQMHTHTHTHTHRHTRIHTHTHTHTHTHSLRYKGNCSPIKDTLCTLYFHICTCMHIVAGVTCIVLPRN